MIAIIEAENIAKVHLFKESEHIMCQVARARPGLIAASCY